MGMLCGSLSKAPLLRVDSIKNIEECWDSHSLQFSCAANWIQYANTKNRTIGDAYECVFSRIPQNKSVLIRDCYGIPLENNIQTITDTEYPEYKFLRYVPTMLIPAMCFFSFAGIKPNGNFYIKGNDGQNRFYLDKYAQFMGYKLEDAGFLYIHDVGSFIKELQEQIPSAVAKNINNLTQNRFYLPLPKNEWLFAKEICYGRHQRTEVFDEKPTSPDELFWKFPEYEEQHESRLIIPHWNFFQEYDPRKTEKYVAEKNKLRVQLPHLHEYAKFF